MAEESSDGGPGGRATDDDRHLATRHLEGDLVGRSVRGGVVTLGAQAVKVVVQLAALALLARLLAPGDFGLFAMVVVILTLLELVRDLGLSSATIQRPSLTRGQVSTLFWVNMGLGVAVAATAAALAPLLAWFYGEPALLQITPVVAVAFLFTALAAQHLALMRRQMRFVAVSAVQVGAEIVALSAAVGAALAGLGFWALVIQRLTWAVATAAGAWLACGWRPGLPGPLAEVRGLIAFGGNTTAAMAINRLAASVDKVLIGWYWGAAPLGMFERSQRLLQLPIQNLNIPLATVALPALSRLADQPDRYRASYVATAGRLAMLIAPLGGLLIAAAEPVVVLVLGDQWEAAGAILMWMGISAVYMPVTYSLSWLYMSQDRTREMLRAGCVNGGLTVAAALCGLPFGPAGVAAAYAVSGALLRVPVLCWLVTRRGPVQAGDFWRILAPPALAAGAVAGAVWLARQGLAGEGLALPYTVGILVLVAGTVALLVLATLPSGREALRGVARLPDLLAGRANA